jgi:formylmethanofuran dehydrogenase subunit C
LPEGHTVVVVMLQGAVQVNGDAIALVRLDREGGEIALEGTATHPLLILSGLVR